MNFKPFKIKMDGQEMIVNKNLVNGDKLTDGLTDMFAKNQKEQMITLEYEDGTSIEIPASSLQNMGARDYVNNIVLIRAKRYDKIIESLDSEEVILRYFDMKENKWKSPDNLGLNGMDVLIPLFYRDLYSGIYTLTNMVFYAKKEHLGLIKQMLNRDREEIRKIESSKKEALLEFTKGLIDEKPEVKEEIKEVIQPVKETVEQPKKVNAKKEVKEIDALN
jgi:hypothetical protein